MARPGVRRLISAAMVFVLTGSEAALARMEDSRCVIGSNAFPQYADEVDAPSKLRNNLFIQYWRRDVERGPVCPAPSGILSQLPDFEPVKPKVKLRRECVQAAMMNIPFLPGVEYSACASPSDDTRAKEENSGEVVKEEFTPRLTSYKRDGRDIDPYARENAPCISNAMIDYMTWAMNKALQCFSTLGDQLDPVFFFRKLNHEASLGYFVFNKGGKGMGQLTSHGVSGSLGAGRETVAYELLERMTNEFNPACEPFIYLLTKKLRYRAGGKTYERDCVMDIGKAKWTGSDCKKSIDPDKVTVSTCQLVDTGEGVGYNLMGSVLLYFQYRKIARNYFKSLVEHYTLTEEGRKANPERAKIFDERRKELEANRVRLTENFMLLNYSAMGPGGAQAKRDSYLGAPVKGVLLDMENEDYIKKNALSWDIMKKNLSKIEKDTGKSDAQICVEK